MTKIKLSDYIAKRLKEQYKVNNIFMVSGGGAMHLNDSFGKYIPYIANHHEQACAISAEGYSRVEQKLAVVNVTTGPGGLNCLNGVFGQWTDSVPVLYISGQVKTSTCLYSASDLNLRQLGDQEVDIISIVKPITKYAVMVKNPNEIKYHLDRAIYEATTGRFAPVWLDIPIDIQASMIDENELFDFVLPHLKNFELNISDVIKKLNSSTKPLIIAGHGIRLSKKIEEFKSFIKKTNIPVVTTFNSMDLFESDDKNFVGRIGTVGQRAGNFALQNADLVLCLGTRNNIRQVSYNYENFAKNAYKIVVDIDLSELNKPLVKPDLKVCADLKDFIPKLNTEKIKEFSTLWLKFCKDLQNKYSFENVLAYKSNDKINVYDFVHELTSCMEENSILTAANGSACVCLHQVGVVKQNQRIIFNSGNASMGYDLPSAIGACVYSHRPVICLAGDGSIMMNLQEIQTIKHNNLPIKIFVINNGGYSSIRQTQKNFFEGRLTASGINSGVSVPDFYRIAEAFKIKPVKLDNPKNMKKIIREVLKSSEPILCEVITEEEYIFQPKLSSRINEDGSMTSPSLDDMFPFVDKEIF
jgi:acetolactate synthase-1/2/3 large subunit